MFGCVNRIVWWINRVSVWKCLVGITFGFLILGIAGTVPGGAVQENQAVGKDHLLWGFTNNPEKLEEWWRTSGDLSRDSIYEKARLTLEVSNRRQDREWLPIIENLLQLARSSQGKEREKYCDLGEEACSLLLEAWGDRSLPEVSAEGGKDLDNHRLRILVLAYAARYYFKGDQQDADHARRILLQYATQMKHWPIAYNRDQSGKWVSANNKQVYRQWGSGGIWGSWYHLDLRQSYPLLLAFDLIKPRLSTVESKQIIEGVFDYHVAILKRYPRPDFRNLLPYQIEGLIQYGRVTENADWVHEAVSLIHDLYYVAFYPDGMWREATPAYHRQVRGNLASAMNLLSGYSDPEGYLNTDTNRRFDDLDLAAEFGGYLQNMDSAMDKIMLPDGLLPALNDSDPGYVHASPRHSTQSALLGASGFAILGSGEGDRQQQVMLKFSGTHGHEHLDMLNLHWYALGRRLFDETRYRPMPGSSSTREWHTMTASHNTVVIDERNQLNRFAGSREFGPDDSIRGYVNYHSRDVLGGTRHQGDLLLFDGRGKPVQVVEVEGRNAYGELAEIYRRNLVKVQTPGSGYIVDIFRVKGGSVHDYMLHGALHQPYEARVSLETEPVNLTLHKYIQVSQFAATGAPWKLDFVYPDGARSRSHVLWPQTADLYLGEAPAINRLESAPFVAIRNEETDSVFVVVHEANREDSGIVSARLLLQPQGAKGPLAVEIDLGNGRVDRVMVGDAQKSVRLESSAEQRIEFEGSLSWSREVGGEVEQAMLWDGKYLRHNGVSLIELSEPAFQGEVLGTLRRSQGDPFDAIIVSGIGYKDLINEKQVIHVDLGEMVWSYIIEGVQENSSAGNTMIRVEHDPGFVVESDGLTKMLYFPGWGSRKTPLFRIPLVGEYQAGHLSVDP